MPDRRTFLIACGSVVVTPALAHFPLPSPVRDPSAYLPPAPFSLSLKIDGWEPQTVNGSDVWIQINSSWRATWR